MAIPVSRPLVCLVAGTSGSGKTTLVERLLPALTARGVVTATVKHHRHPVEVDVLGKDTWRHRRAGAHTTFFVTADQLVTFQDRPVELDPGRLAERCPPEVDLLLVEGFKGVGGYGRIEVVRRGAEREIACTDEVWWVATDIDGFDTSCPVCGLDDVEAMADLLVDRLSSDATCA